MSARPSGSSSPTSATRSAPSRRWGRSGSRRPSAADPADRRPDEGKGRIRGLEAQRPPARPDRGRDGRRATSPGWRPGRAAARREEPGELEAITASAEFSDGVYRWAIGCGLAGKTEREVARACRRGSRNSGAEPSTPPIVAGAANGALPHAEPGEREIGSGEFIMFDMGAELDGYCSDCTRTYATGDPGDGARELYELVLRAQKALDAIRPNGRQGSRRGPARDDLEGVLRTIRTGPAMGSAWVPGAPRPATSEDELAEGNVVTVEPGVYLPGRFGVRIEDLVVVTRGGRNLGELAEGTPARRLGGRLGVSPQPQANQGVDQGGEDRRPGKRPAAVPECMWPVSIATVVIARRRGKARSRRRRRARHGRGPRARRGREGAPGCRGRRGTGPGKSGTLSIASALSVSASRSNAIPLVMKKNGISSP